MFRAFAASMAMASVGCAGPRSIPAPRAVVVPITTVAPPSADTPADASSTTGSAESLRTLPLNVSAVPFASYLHTIHNRIHPQFSDGVLKRFDALPSDHPVNDKRLVTRLEIVVNPKEGRIAKIGVVKTSGVLEFDVAAMDSVQRAQPFGPAPVAIVSADGNVDVHWELHRDDVIACSTMHSRALLLGP